MKQTENEPLLTAGVKEVLKRSQHKCLVCDRPLAKVKGGKWYCVCLAAGEYRQVGSEKIEWTVSQHNVAWENDTPQPRFNMKGEVIS